jgi:hypothetical protein
VDTGARLLGADEEKTAARGTLEDAGLINRDRDRGRDGLLPLSFSRRGAASFCFLVRPPATHTRTNKMTSLSGLAKVVVEFAPAAPASRAAREFWARVSCSRTRANFPDCAVEAVRLPDAAAPPRVVVELAEGKKRESLDIAGLTASQVAARVAALGAGGPGAGGPAAALTAPAGGKGGGGGGGPPPKLETRWGAGDVDAGVPAKVPVGTS